MSDVQRIEIQSRSGCMLLLLWALLGEFGVHRLYAGKTVSGIIMLIGSIACLISFLASNSRTIWFSITILVIWALWYIIDFFIIICGKWNKTTVHIENKTIKETVNNKN